MLHSTKLTFDFRQNSPFFAVTVVFYNLYKRGDFLRFYLSMRPGLHDLCLLIFYMADRL